MWWWVYGGSWERVDGVGRKWEGVERREEVGGGWERGLEGAEAGAGGGLQDGVKGGGARGGGAAAVGVV